MVSRTLIFSKFLFMFSFVYFCGKCCMSHGFAYGVFGAKVNIC